jgi:hypothetical protein
LFGGGGLRGVEASEQQLMWAVQALAQSADVQPTLFPPFVLVADELALELDHWREVAEGYAGGSWSPAQRAAVAAVDAALSAMTDVGRPELWDEPGCLSRPEWAEVRRLARAALAAFGWPAGMPPDGRGVYVPGG